MSSRVEQAEQLTAELRTISQSNTRQEVERELRRILESDGFASSNRSCKFLQHVIEKSLAGEFEALKERILGMELFGRSSTFDTDHDSVVRVAASDVRRRLREYYRKTDDSRVRIDLPPGLYLPQIEILPEPRPAPAPPASLRKPFPWRLAAIWAGGLSLAALIALAAVLVSLSPGGRKAQQTPPWSMLFRTGKTVDIVPADANLVIAKVRSQQDIPIEAYHDRTFSYAGDLSGALGVYLNRIPLTTVSDAILAGRISDLAARSGARAQILPCNRIDFSELKGDAPVVLLGSPTSNPWVQLLYDQLDFQVVHRFEDGYDICINRHPKPGERPVYVPALHRQGFSEGFAIISVMPNLTGKAPVLIIAGTSTEGTEAAGDFVTNLDRLSESLQKLGIGTRQPAGKIELLIKTSFVSSASASSQIIAFRTAP